jgi:hypothetical protein
VALALEDGAEAVAELDVVIDDQDRFLLGHVRAPSVRAR